MHPGFLRGRRLGAGRSSAGAECAEDEELDELLYEQAEFGRSKKAPAATCVRAPRPSNDGPGGAAGAKAAAAGGKVAAGASEDGDQGATVGKKRPASLFKQLRQGGIGTLPTGGAAKPHPEITALPELEGPDKEDLKCLAENVAERPPQGAAASVAADAAGALSGPHASATGFPVPQHRALGQRFGRGQSKPSAPASDELDGDPSDEEEAIDLENRRALAKATPEEIGEWQQQILQQFGSQTCEFLRKRGQEKMRQREEASQTKATGAGAAGGQRPGASGEDFRAETKDLGKEAAATPGEDGAKAPQISGAEAKKEPVLDTFQVELHVGEEDAMSGSSPAADTLDALRALSGGCFDRAEMQKLQWTMPVGAPDIDAVVADESLPPEPAGKVIQLLRFDFEGRICLRTDSGEEAEAADAGPDVSEGLHHHGAESSQAGYTLAEILILTRSSNAPQRALAFRTLARVLEHAHVRMGRGELLGDPALQKAGELGGAPADGAALRAGFGMGLAVFFWHGVARGDLPKHLVEGMGDPTMIVQLGALCSIIALLDGLAPAMVGGSSEGATAPSSVVRGLPAPSPLTQHRGAETGAGAPLDRTLGTALDAARELVWPSAPPASAARLASRARVAVLTEEGGGGGGTASWPHLLRRRLLGAPEEAEVTGADVLEPLLAPGRDALDVVRAGGGGVPLPQLILGIRQYMAGVGDDRALLALAVRALAAACSWSASLCMQVLEGNAACRGWWLQRAGGGETTGDAGQLRLEVLRLLRRSCQVGGRAACAWWFGSDASGGSPDAEHWTAVTAVRRAVLDVVGSQDIGHTADTVTGTKHLCAVEGLRTWIAWIACGAGIDAIGSFAPTFGTYWHRFADANASGHSDSMGHSDWIVVALMLQLSTSIVRAAACSTTLDEEAEQLSMTPLQAVGADSGRGIVAVAADAAGPLAAALARVGADSAAPKQLCVAALAELLAAAAQPSEASGAAFAAAGKALLAGQSRGGSEVPEVPTASGIADDDVEAPWPAGGTASGPRLECLARLRALRSLCDLAACLGEGSCVPWLSGVADQVGGAVASRAPSAPPLAGAVAISGAVQRDPWAALLAAAWRGLSACGAAPMLDVEEVSRALAASGCLPTARAVLACAGLELGDAGCDAVARAAFRPEAPWTGVSSDIASRAARASGHTPVWSLTLDPPPALGPPTLAFAAAPFWALVAGPPLAAAMELLDALTKPTAGLAAAAVSPPWLPFVAFASVLSAPLGESQGESWAWTNPALRSRLCAFAKLHLTKSPSTWLSAGVDWLCEALRGLCDRTAIAFVEESFGDSLLASALWAFAAPGMPQECRATCWGMQDPAVLALLSRSLPADVTEGGSEAGASGEGLLWPMSDYLGPGAEDPDTVAHAVRLLGLADEEGGGQGGARRTARSWPALLALHHRARQSGRPSPLGDGDGGPQRAEGGAGVPAVGGSLDEME